MPDEEGQQKKAADDGTVTVDVAMTSFFSSSKLVTEALLLDGPTKWLMPCVPLAIICALLSLGDGFVFAFSLLALLPLAERLSFVTDCLASHTNQTLAGLLNATFGNVPELIVAMQAVSIRNGNVAQLSLLGSSMENAGLVFATALIVGGVRHHALKFNKAAAGIFMMCNLLGFMCIGYVSLLRLSNPEESVEITSRCVALIMVVVYAITCIFQLRTHTELFEDEEEGDEEEEEEEAPQLGLYSSLGALAVLTVFIAVLSDMLVSSLEPTAVNWGVGDLFLGIIVLPFVSNAAEHSSAIIFAWKGKMDVAIGIALGSAMQIILFVYPVIILFAWVVGYPLTLVSENIEVEAGLFIIATLSFMLVLGHPTLHYLHGVLLLGLYCLVAFGFTVQSTRQVAQSSFDTSVENPVDRSDTTLEPNLDNSTLSSNLLPFNLMGKFVTRVPAHIAGLSSGHGRNASHLRHFEALHALVPPM